MTTKLENTKLETYLAEHPADVCKNILEVDAKSTSVAPIFRSSFFKAGMVEAHIEDLQSTSSTPLSEEELDAVLSAAYGSRGENEAPQGALLWDLTDGGYLTLVDESWEDYDLPWSKLVDTSFYPMLAALTVAFEDLGESITEVQKDPADVRAALERIADPALLRLMRAEFVRADAQATALVARSEFFVALWGHVDVAALAAGDSAAVEAYVGFSEELRFQAQVLMGYLGLERTTLEAHPLVMGLNPEFKNSALGAAAACNFTYGFESFEAMMEYLGARYAEHQAYVNDPGSYLDVDDERLARNRVQLADGAVLAERILARFSNPSPTSEVVAERYAWVHAQGEAGVEPTVFKEAFHSLESAYKVLLLITSSTGALMRVYNDILIGDI